VTRKVVLLLSANRATETNTKLIHLLHNGVCLYDRLHRAAIILNVGTNDCRDLVLHSTLAFTALFIVKNLLYGCIFYRTGVIAD